MILLASNSPYAEAAIFAFVLIWRGFGPLSYIILLDPGSD
jgi:hypothetical protein